MFGLRVFFPSGSCFAASADNPAQPEWPPHPSRLFSAMTAATYLGNGGMSVNKRRALVWLESQEPPTVLCAEADVSTAPTQYVPPADITGRKGKKGEEKIEHPIGRWRQGRSFPVARILGPPFVEYGWTVQPEPDIAATLKRIARDVSHVGTSHSFAIVDTITSHHEGLTRLVPNPVGEHYLRVPVPGRLQELDGIFANEYGIRRPLSSHEPLVSYRREQFTGLPRHQALFDMVVFRILGPRYHSDICHIIGRAVRQAVMSVMGDQAPAEVHGHGKPQDHVGWIPLPDVGHPHSKGRIIGLGMAIPRSMNRKDVAALLGAMGKLSDVHLPDGRDISLVPVRAGDKLPATLRSDRWSRAATIWDTVTPVVIDRAPKKLNKSDIQIAIRDSIVNSGYPVPERIEVSPNSFVQGAPKALEIRTKMRRFHARVWFSEPIQGVVLAGRLRYFGVGLFMPVKEGG